MLKTEQLLFFFFSSFLFLFFFFSFLPFSISFSLFVFLSLGPKYFWVQLFPLLSSHLILSFILTSLLIQTEPWDWWLEQGEIDGQPWLMMGKHQTSWTDVGVTIVVGVVNQPLVVDRAMTDLVMAVRKDLTQAFGWVKVPVCTMVVMMVRVYDWGWFAHGLECGGELVVQIWFCRRQGASCNRVTLGGFS